MKQKLFVDPSSGKSTIDRRSGLDRRARTLRSVLFNRGRRRRQSKGRRKTDKGGYVDTYDLQTWSIAIAILFLSLMDALLTGLHVLRGSAWELNPVMRAVLSQGGLPAFFGLKAIMTILPVAILMLHKEWALGRYAAKLCLCSYILVSLYHMFLIFVLHVSGGHPSSGI